MDIKTEQDALKTYFKIEIYTFCNIIDINKYTKLTKNMTANNKCLTEIEEHLKNSNSYSVLWPNGKRGNDTNCNISDLETIINTYKSTKIFVDTIYHDSLSSSQIYAGFRVSK